VAAALFSSILSIARSLLHRRDCNPLPTMHSLRVRGGQRGCPPGGSFCSERQRAARAPTLRVVRDTGRIVISGRMADVCAELDRLAAMEGA
jgi:hypothetical protein